ncbi:hypothetical protein I545_1756 [Mycobacterium kansasii 662]|uniref:Uncharacterized protein n=2 Tax=Mycobacterium kansasii TaxID=1768 RepID=A0A1V3XMD9_MYCKA|nr:hypothetical protein I547_3525 [Mycobacterium kansasii 824]EUA19973.1 hypothetical protein I545_1756 [Mycobacterium kansasii 662]KEP39785.1 hypothetical protein MKSMC1_50780 [Mycobacterium kansasii]OOK80365.1 hypothetical protein BZL29_2605 [Mycobacterium kansasii]
MWPRRPRLTAALVSLPAVCPHPQPVGGAGLPGGNGGNGGG